MLFDLRVHNPENNDIKEGGYILCGNHISMIDPVILAVSTKRQIHFMGKKELFENKFFGYVFRKLGGFPVDRQGVSLSAIKNSIEILNNGGILGIFPEGTRISEGFDEKNAKPGVAIIAAKSKTKILPFFIKGPYRFRGRIDIIFGEPKDYFENFEGKIKTEKYVEIGKNILYDIYNLNR
jgi:1-acyl-sn-glycerol-3-phosphate acyltransferase